MDQNARLFEHAFHPLRIGNKVGREVSAVKLHAFDHFELCLHGLGFLDGDDPIFAHLLHGFGDDRADLLVIVCGDGTDLRDHVAFDILVEFLDLLHCHFDGALDTALQCHGAGPRCHGFHAFAKNRLGEYGRGGGAVAGHVGGLGSNLTHHLRAHVFKRILQLDLLGHGHAVLGDDGRTEFLLDHGIPALRPERDLDRVRQKVNAAENRLT